MKLPLPRVACPHATRAAMTSRPKPCPCALSLSQRPSSGETESAPSNEAMPKHSRLSSRRITKENWFGAGVCTLFSHRVRYSLHDGGSHGMNLAMAGVMHLKTSCASIIWNWLSCNLRDWMTIIVSAYQRRIICQIVRFCCRFFLRPTTINERSSAQALKLSQNTGTKEGSGQSNEKCNLRNQHYPGWLLRPYQIQSPR